MDTERFFDLIPDLAVIASTDGYFKRVNPAWEKTLGYSTSELLSQPFENFMHPDDIEPTRREVSRQVSGQHTINFINRYRTKDGAYKWLEWQATPAVNGSDLYAVARDITESKKLEDAWHDSESLFHSAFDNGNIGLAITSLDQKWLRVNHSLCGMLGYSKEELKQKTWAEMTYPDDLEPDLRQFRRVIAGDIDSYEMEKRFFRKDGTLVYTELTLSCVRNYNRSVKYFIASLQDITERQVADQKMQESEEKYRRIVETSAEGIILTGLDGVITYANNRMGKIIGCSKDELIGKVGASFMVKPELAPKMRNTISQGSYATDFEIKCVGGEHRWVMGKATPMINDRKEQIGNLAMFTDITERKAAEQRYRELAENITDIFFAMDKDLRYIYWNQATEKQVGIPAEQAIGKTLYDIFPDTQARDEVIRIYKQVLDTRKAQRVTVRYPGDQGIIHELNVYPTSEGIEVLVKDVTHEFKLRQSLTESEARLKTAQKVARLGNWEWDLVTNVLWWADSNYDIHGIDPDKVKPSYDAFLSLVVPSERKYVNQSVADAVAGKKDFEIDYTIIRPDNGEKRIIHSIAEVIKDATGKSVKMVGTVQDVTRQKQVEDEIRTILRTTIDAFYLVDTTGRLLDVNDAYCSLIGYSREELLCMKVADIEAIEDQAAIDARVKRIMETGHDHFETKHIRKDGAVIDIEASVNLLVQEQPKLFIFMRDITERKQALLALQHSAERDQVIIHTAIDGFWLVDLQGKLLEVNAAYAKMSGYSEEELLNLHVSDMDTIETTQDTSVHIQKVVTQGYDRFETKHRRKTGETFDVEVSAKYLNLDGGRVVCFYKDITKRKEAEKRLAQSEAHFRALFEKAAEGIIYINPDFRISDVNEAFARMHGYSLEEIKRLNVQDLDIDDLAKVNPERLARMARGEDLVFEVRHRHKDGHIIYLEVSATYAPNSHGGYLAFHRDITERKKIETALRASEQMLKNAEKTAQIGYYQIDLNTGLAEWSDETFAIFGLDPGHGPPTAESYSKYVHPDDSTTLNQNYEKCIKEHQPFHMVYRIIRTNGEIRWVQSIGKVETDPEDAALKLFGTIQDITTQVQAENKLKQSQATLELYIDHSPDGIFIVNRFGYYLDVNPAACALLGYSKEKILEMSIADVTPPELVEQVREEFNKLKELGKISLDLPLLRSDASFVDVHLIATSLPGDKYIAYCRDITERRKAEEYQKLMERQAQNAARLASIGEMASGVAHEINNPLTPALLFSQLLLKRDLPEDVMADLRIIHESARRASEVTKRMLTFARQNKPKRILCDINEVVETTLELRDYNLELNKIAVFNDLDPALPATLADGSQLQQVVLNLIMNAEYALSQITKERKIVIKTQHIDDNIRLAITDNGPGIKAEHMEKLFTPFFTTKKAGEGTGLGLSVCHGIVAEHGGRIYVESQEGQGATFIIEIPVVIGLTTEPVMPPESSWGKTIEGDKPAVLVVDDEESILQIVKRILVSEGFNVQTAGSAEEAFKLIQTTFYAAILLDIKLPDMTGTELYEKLEKDGDGAIKRITFITGDVLGTDSMVFFERTKAPYISKPFDADQLKTAVKRLM